MEKHFIKTFGEFINEANVSSDYMHYSKVITDEFKSHKIDCKFVYAESDDDTGDGSGEFIIGKRNFDYEITINTPKNSENGNLELILSEDGGKEWSETFKNIDDRTRKHIAIFIVDKIKSEGKNLNEKRVSFKGKTVADLAKIAKNKSNCLIFANNKHFSLDNFESSSDDSVIAFDDEGAEKEIKIKDIEFIEINESLILESTASEDVDAFYSKWKVEDINKSDRDEIVEFLDEMKKSKNQDKFSVYSISKLPSGPGSSRRSSSDKKGSKYKFVGLYYGISENHALLRYALERNSLSIFTNYENCITSKIGKGEINSEIKELKNEIKDLNDQIENIQEQIGLYENIK